MNNFEQQLLDIAKILNFDGRCSLSEEIEKRLSKIAALEKRLADAELQIAAVKSMHNGYDPEYCKVHGQKEPETIADAVRELLDEANEMADVEMNTRIGVEERYANLKALNEATTKCNICLADAIGYIEDDRQRSEVALDALAVGLADAERRCVGLDAKNAAWEGVSRANCELIKDLKGAIMGALKISNLWVPYEMPKVEHRDEAVALHKMHNIFYL